LTSEPSLVTAFEFLSSLPDANVTRATLICLLTPFVFAVNWAFAENDNLAALAAPSFAAPDSEGSPDTTVLEVPVPPVVIEGEAPRLEPTPDELIQRFRESLKAPPSFLSSERRLADGNIEVTTRFGRFCAPSLPVQFLAGVGGDVRLAAHCTSF
jgi:hypothetical protein